MRVRWIAWGALLSGAVVAAGCSDSDKVTPITEAGVDGALLHTGGRGGATGRPDAAADAGGRSSIGRGGADAGNADAETNATGRDAAQDGSDAATEPDASFDASDSG
jgi:hypothetical protein